MRGLDKGSRARGRELPRVVRKRFGGGVRTDSGTPMQPWQEATELAQFRKWLRRNARDLVDSVSIAAKVEPAVVLRVLDALHCHAMGGKGAGDACLSEIADANA